MKQIVLILGLIVVFFTACGKKIPSNAIKETFHVSGNCGMCKKTIENSLKLEGIYRAKWNKKTKLITVVFDSTVISLIDIQKRIADAGYDNDGFKATQSSYDKLHSCCKYDRK